MKAPIKGNSTHTLTFATSKALIPAFAPALAPGPPDRYTNKDLQNPILTPASALSLGPPGRYMDKDLQRATKLALDLFVKDQEYGQIQASTASCKRFFKAWFSNFYYANSYLDCY